MCFSFLDRFLSVCEVLTVLSVPGLQLVAKCNARVSKYNTLLAQKTALEKQLKDKEAEQSQVSASADLEAKIRDLEAKNRDLEAKIREFESEVRRGLPVLMLFSYSYSVDGLEHDPPDVTRLVLGEHHPSSEAAQS